MKTIYLFIFIAMNQIACSQQKEVVILKKCITDGKESFTNKSYICEKMVFNGLDIMYKINYSYNGWQIYDSIFYENKGAKYCVKSYHPIYDIESRLVKKYELNAIDYNQEKKFTNKHLIEIDDMFYLSRTYLADLNFLLERNPEMNRDTFQFKEGIIPSLFTKYGIPYNEQMNAFKFSVQSDLIENDSFFFEGYILKRHYRYDGRMLNEVQIIVENKKDKTSYVYKEYFQMSD